MKLKFEVVKTLDSGESPDVIQFQDSEAQTFNVSEGRLKGKPSDKIVYGDWGEHFKVDKTLDVSPDSNMSNFSINSLSGFGIIGGYKKTEPNVEFHKLIIYEFAQKIDKYLKNGSISQRLNNPIDSFSLTLSNPDIKNPEKPGNIIMNEKGALAIPGSKVRFKFGLGSKVEPDYDMGEFYIDSSSYAHMSETASVDGRNLIGKALREQTLDDNNVFDEMLLHDTIKKILEDANLSNDQYIVQPSSYTSGWKIEPNVDVLSAIESILNIGEPLWIMRQLSDGVIVIGDPNYIWFDRPGTHRFERSKDIFSRGITYDDANSYSKVCVHDSDFNIAVYTNVDSYSGWNLQANRTLYVDMPEGVTEDEARNYSKELARQLENAGKLETFNGPFKPYIQPGDAAVIDDGTESTELGLITDITHTFGSSGFSTNFTVDSGGTIGKGRISDYINKIASKNGSSSGSVQSIK